MAHHIGCVLEHVVWGRQLPSQPLEQVWVFLHHKNNASCVVSWSRMENVDAGSQLQYVAGVCAPAIWQQLRSSVSTIN